MPMLDIQRRHAEVFRIRLGDKGTKGAPRKLTDQIRVTSGGSQVVQAFVDVYGGEVTPFTEQSSKHNFQAYLPTTALAVMVLPGQSIEQWWELWKGSVCDRRCDGEVEQLSGGPCRCNPDPYERANTQGQCSPMTRLNVLCPDVDVVGAGSLVTHGMIAAETLPQSIAVAETALSRGLMVPAVLRVVEHKGKRHFIYPQLEIVGVSLNALAAGGQGQVGAVRDLAQPKPPQLAAPAVSRPVPPLPGEVTGSSGGDARSPAGGQKAEGAPSASPPDTDKPMSTQQSRAVHMLLKKKMGVSGDERHPVLSGLLGRTIGSASEVTWDEASRLIDQLQDEDDHQEPS